MEILQGVWKQHLRPRAVVGYGVKIFLPSPPNYVTRSPGSDYEAKVRSLRCFLHPFSPPQHSNPLMKHLTLSLMVVILDRAQNALTCVASSDVVNEQTETTLLQQFREEILKGLCDLSLVITLRQNLVIAAAKEKEESEKGKLV